MAAGVDRSEYFQVNVAQTLLQGFAGSSQSDTVNITIYNVGAATTDVNAAAMTAIGNDSWKYSWTPTALGAYLIKFNNVTSGFIEYLYAGVIGNIALAASGSISGSTLTVLQKEFLLGIDNYNSDDLTGDGSGGDRATSSLNKALQVIYSLLKDSKYMKAYPSTGLATTANQDYIDLGAVTDLDEIEDIVDPTNIYKLIKIPYWRYKEWSPDPSSVTGIPTHYARLFNRIYMYPRPTAIYTYNTTYVKVYGDLSAGSDQALLPSKYNYWIYAEAEVQWYKMQDPNAIPAIVISERDRLKTIAMDDIFSNFNENFVAESVFGRNEMQRRSLYTIA